MRISFKHLAVLGLAAASLSGCATAHYKPQGLTEQEAELKLNDVLYTCQGLRQGTFINISFYPDAAVNEKRDYSGNRSGYFYACNKLNGTLSMSSNRITMFDRGEFFPLERIETITKPPEPIDPTALGDDLLDTIVKKVFQVRLDDPERALLTQ
jgi:hypothetical protein